MRLSPLPGSGPVPERFPHPMSGHDPHPLASRAARELMAELDDPSSARGSAAASEPDGKMYGVLVVREPASGEIGFLAGFSGMLGGRWLVHGFVPPLFDLDERNHFYPEGQSVLAELERELDELAAHRRPIARELDELVCRHQRQLEDLRATHGRRKAERARLRDSLAPGHPHQRDLGHQSSADRRERRALRASHAEAEGELRAELTRLDELAAQVRERRSALSNRLLCRIHDLYRLVDAHRQPFPLSQAYAPGAPPGGAGDCAAPKLLGFANSHGLEPLALAEFWWGPPPETGGRQHRLFYPPCRGKCGPLLPMLLRGRELGVPPRWASDPDARETILHDDPWLLVVEKPAGLLSVPGRGPALRDSVEARLQKRYPGCRAAHRLDLDTSGLLLVSKDERTYAGLQQQFADRAVSKIYLAWVDGEVESDEGRVELPLRLDVDDRPRQIVDPVHGKPAVTRWRVVARRGGRTRVELAPQTGRTHQLRVHAAHPDGIGRPIVGDRLYGFAGPRMMLHATRIELRHPGTGEPLCVSSAAPF